MNFTPAAQKIIDNRNTLNAGRCKVQLKDASTIYVFLTAKGEPAARFYAGRTMKPESYRFSSKDARTAAIKRFVAFRNEHFEAKQAKKAAQSERTLKVGDVVYTSWGYEQTNVDYYKVTKLVGKASYELVEIGANHEADTSMSGRTTPDPTNEIGQPFRKREVNGNLKVDGHHAWKVEQNGGKFDSHYVSSYH